MTNFELENMIQHHQTVSDLVACAMRDYACQQTGSDKWRKACFEFEADYVLSALAQAGYRVVYVFPSRSNEPRN